MNPNFNPILKQYLDATSQMYSKIKKAGRDFKNSASCAYEYSGTRARAMSSKLLQDDDYAKFLKMDIAEIIRFLEEHEYKEEIDAIGVKSSKIQYLEQVLNENLANSIRKILSFIPKKSPLSFFLSRYDIANIKTILRAKETGRPFEEVKRGMIFAGMLSRPFIEKLIESPSRAEVIAGLLGTPYYHGLKSNAAKPLSEIEDALDAFYYEYVQKNSGANPSLNHLVRAEIDIKNILLLMRLKDVKGANLEKYFISGGKITHQKIRKLSKMDFVSILRELKNEDFWKYAPVTVEEISAIEEGARKYTVLTGFELAKKIDAGLRRYLLLTGPRLLRRYLPTFDTVLGYIISKEREIQNIRIIARSKLSKNPEDAVNIRRKVYIK